MKNIVIIIIIIIYTYENFSHHGFLMVSPMILNSSKSPQFSGTLLSIWLISRSLLWGWSPLVFLYPSFQFPLPILCWVHQLPLVSKKPLCSIVFSSLAWTRYSSELLLSLDFILLTAETAKSTLRKDLFSLFPFFCCCCCCWLSLYLVL